MKASRDDLAALLLTGLGEAAKAPLGLAVSGGGDSMALLHLAVAAGLTVRVATVDHGLRPEAAVEAALVAEICAGLKVPHATLQWRGWDGRGNLQDQARQARRRLLAEWAVGSGLPAVALAHTRDDVAETFLMRLARGAGVDGLAAMRSRWHENGLLWLRPLLPASRAELREFLTGLGAFWVDDPSNENLRFDRVKARRVLAQLAPLGLGSERLAEVAGHLAEARDALEVATNAAARRVLETDAGSVILVPEMLLAEPEEIQRRLLQRVIQWVAPADYAPRGPALAGLRDRLARGQPGQLAGCRFMFSRGRLHALREAKAVAGVVAPVTALWDRRWRLTGPFSDGLTLRALGGEGLAQCPDWRATGRLRPALLASPAVWRGDVMVAAPLAAPLAAETAGWRAEVLPGPEVLYTSVLSH